MAFEDPPALILASVAILAAIYVVRWKTHPLNSIPTVGGSSAPGLSILAAINFRRNGKELIEEGYRKYYGSAFKVALIDQWLVIVSGPKMVDELRRRPDNELSFDEGVEDVVQMKYSIGHETFEDPYHINMVKEKLTRTLPVILPDAVDELKLTVPECIPAKTDEWTAVTVMPAMQQIVARVSSRVFVGLPICRNQDYLSMAIRFAIDVIKDRKIITITPYGLKTIVSKLFSKTKRVFKQATPVMEPVINERRANMKAFGEDWSDKPNDLLQWIIDEAVLRNQSNASIVERIFLINFAAIHTSSTTMTHVLYDLAARPEYIQPLREEIEDVLATDGWTKAGIGKMWKLDSLFRESSRLHGISLISLMRKAVKDLTFNDGTFIPKGTVLVAAAHATHHDEVNYADADDFDAFRFARMREGEGEGVKHQFANTSVDYISFGHGKHACPGRFFASNELKAIMAYIVLNYDLKLGGDGQRPPDTYFAQNMAPSRTGQVLFRKRQAASS
ncbi:cytochrome P450 [Dichomitus squalens]|uniref:Cytochrome P450 n=1 Tax=Dichomitus squalens TaxID=114155 RepID=A0A4Q9Q6D6_9APHY|nr:cytochrome P450 [Dichomitus squalens]